jgi:PqqD family protein of HPr-rel-A system
MAGPRYIADAPDEMRSVALDGLTALFHRPSGQTHILASPAPEILAALAQAAADADELIARFGIEGGDAAEAMNARLAELEAAGLVRRA